MLGCPPGELVGVCDRCERDRATIVGGGGDRKRVAFARRRRGRVSRYREERPVSLFPDRCGASITARERRPVAALVFVGDEEQRSAGRQSVERRVVAIRERGPQRV